MSGNNIKLSNTIWTTVKTAAIAIVIIAVVLFAVALVAPFIMCGPQDEFWDMLANGSVNAEGWLVKAYLNILQWLAGIR